MFSRLVRVGAACAISLCTCLVAMNAFSWERGNHAADWAKGATIKVFVDPIPADAPKGTAEAVTEAIKEWNDAQAEFGGLQLMTEGADKTNSEIHIKWNKRLRGWGSTGATKGADRGFTKTTVKVTVKLDPALNARAITRILKHELGHAEGLSHSARSDLMKKRAYSSDPEVPPTAADLNSADAFIAPTADDKAGKKALWGTAPKLSESNTDSSSIFDGTMWKYSYTLRALAGLGLTDPVTEFSLDLPSRFTPSDFEVSVVPPDWGYGFFDDLIGFPGEGFDDGEGLSPSVLSFFALTPESGAFPGDVLDFGIRSIFGPAGARAFTNSPSFDSDEFMVLAPSLVSEPAPSWLLAAGLSGLLASRWVAGRRSGAGPGRSVPWCGA